jgi:hypothetical protein
VDNLPKEGRFFLCLVFMPYDVLSEGKKRGGGGGGFSPSLFGDWLFKRITTHPTKCKVDHPHNKLSSVGLQDG